MAETIRMNIRVEEDIPGKLAELAGSQKRMGQYLGTLIRQVHAGQVETGQPGELEALTNTVRHLSLKVKEMDAQLAQLQAEVRRASA